MRVVFLDRDGVVNEDREDYVKSWDEFVLIEGSLEALALLNRAGWEIILVTNQSGVGRGLYPEETVHDVHARLARRAETAGARIKDIFYCPHAPGDNCDCRKPEPGMFHAAQKAHGLDLSRCIMIGDS
ncbi:MAG: HAD family hydrolase, partial [Deltaproteobacteria bacterium]|nr:HAD family hydrolase [Deltaproteobacteria bacterium]